MNWKIGQKIVCVDELSQRPGEEDVIEPIVGEIYTIRGITSAGSNTGFYLVEIKNPPRKYSTGFLETAFDSTAFRPL